MHLRGLVSRTGDNLGVTSTAHRGMREAALYITLSRVRRNIRPRQLTTTSYVRTNFRDAGGCPPHHPQTQGQQIPPAAEANSVSYNRTNWDCPQLPLRPPKQRYAADKPGAASYPLHLPRTGLSHFKGTGKLHGAAARPATGCLHKNCFSESLTVNCTAPESAQPSSQ